MRSKQKINKNKKTKSNGKKIACVGAGPASLTVARDLAPLGYDVTVFDQDPKPGGMIWSQIPRFRLPEERDRRRGWLHSESGRRLQAEKNRFHESPHERGLRRHLRRLGRAARARPRHSRAARKARRTSTSASTGCRRCPSATPRRSASASSCWAAATPRWTAAAPRKRIGGDDVKVIVRSGFDEMKASPWEKEDAAHEGIPILNFLVPKSFSGHERKAVRHDLRKSQGRLRFRREKNPGTNRRARPVLRMRRRAGRGGAGERLPLDRAGLRASSSTRVACRN